MSKLRIQRLLADAGLASRRFAEQMILDGRVTVNGKLVIELPCFIDPDHDDVRLDNQPVRKKAARKINLLLNKPRGVECTRVTTGRPGVFDVVPPIRGQAFCVAPLDQDSTGLVIITNDGQLRQLMTHHRYTIERTYVVEVDGSPSPEALDAMRKGVYLDQKRTRPASVVVLGRNAGRTMLGVKITETHNRELRRILVKLGHKPRRFKRSAIGTITDKGLKIGHFRQLNDHELQALERQATAPEPKAPVVTAPQSIPAQDRVPAAERFPQGRNASDRRPQGQPRRRAQGEDDEALPQQPGSMSDGPFPVTPKRRDEPSRKRSGGPVRTTRKRTAGPFHANRKRAGGPPHKGGLRRGQGR
jgi:23S rRNA pseudouridine2605 synthase